MQRRGNSRLLCFLPIRTICKLVFLTLKPSQRIVATAQSVSRSNQEIAMTEKVGASLLARWNRELFSMIYATLLSLLFYFSPGWDPITNANGKQGALIVCAFLIFYVFYLAWQAWPLVRGEVGTAFSQTTDAIFSSFPVMPVLVAIMFHFTGYYEQSFTNLVIATSTIVIVVFDILIFGGIGSLVNRLTLDVHGAGRRGLI